MNTSLQNKPLSIPRDEITNEEKKINTSLQNKPLSILRDEKTNEEKKINTSLPIINTSLPIINTSLPIINTSLPMMNTSLPMMNTSLPIINTTLPMMNTTNEENKINTEEDKIKNILNDFIKNNNLSYEEQKIFYDELKKINNKLPANKKVVISFEKNNFKFQVLDIVDKLSNEKINLKVSNATNPNDNLEIKTYNFDKNMWYILLSSIILTFLITAMLIIKWKEPTS
jgi:hypothetical protein